MRGEKFQYRSTTALMSSRIGHHVRACQQHNHSHASGDTCRRQPRNMTLRQLLRRAQGCLRLTTPGLNLTYPADAAAHLEEIRRAMAPWSRNASGYRMHRHAKYRGPWVENVWIETFERRWEQRAPGEQPQHIFGAFIPIFVPWVDWWCAAVQRAGRRCRGASRKAPEKPTELSWRPSGGGRRHACAVRVCSAAS